MKKFIIVLFTIIISILTCLLCISHGIKDAVVNTLSSVVVKNEITSKIVSSVKEYYPGINYETLEEVEKRIGNNEKINDLTAKYFDGIIDSVLNNKEVKLPDTKEELLALIDDNEAVLKERGIEVSPEQKQRVVDEIVNGGVIENVYEKVTVTVKSNLTNKQQKLVEAYNFMSSKTIMLALSLSIIILIILIAILKKTFYRWSLNLAISSAISGVIIVFLTPLITNYLGDELASELVSNPVSVNVNMITNAGYICLAVSALSIIIYFIGNKITKYNENKYAE